MTFRLLLISVTCLAILPGAHAAPDEVVVKGLLDFWRTLGKEQEETAIKKSAEKAASEKPSAELATRKLHPGDMHRISQADLASLDLTTMAWQMADEAVQKRVKTEAVFLRLDLNAEAEKIREDEGLPEECLEPLMTTLERAVCKRVTAKATGDKVPDDDASEGDEETKSVLNCLGMAAARRVAKAADQKTAALIEKTVKAIHDAAGRPPALEPLDAAPRNKLLLLAYALCKATG